MYSGFAQAVELLRSSIDGTYSVSPSCASLTRGYRHSTPSEFIDGTYSVSPSCAALTRGYRHSTPSEFRDGVHSGLRHPVRDAILVENASDKRGAGNPLGLPLSVDASRS